MKCCLPCGIRAVGISALGSRYSLIVTSSKHQSRLLVLTCLLLLLALGLRLYHLDWQAIWEDEGFSVYYASLGLRQLLHELPVDHVPLYYLLMRPWTRLAGISEFSVRFPSLCLPIAECPRV